MCRSSQTSTAAPPRRTRATRSRFRAPRRSACRTSSSTSSGFRRSCSRSTRPPACSTASAGRSSPGINEIETDYGRNLNVSSAGALGWMQFMPATWKAYGVDANRDGVKDPFNPVDAIFAAARYLKAAGAETDLRKAVFAYNHADWYVDSVLMRAQVIGGIPGDLVGSLTGLTQGRFPVRAKATYAGALKKADRRPRAPTPPSSSSPTDAPQHRDLRQGRLARDRRQRRQGPQARRQQAPRPLHRGPGRLRQHIHLRRTSRRSPRPTRAQEAHPQEGQGRQAPRPRPSTSPRPTRRPPTAAEPSRAETETAAGQTAPVAKVRLFAHPKRKNALRRRRRRAGRQQAARLASAGAPLGLDPKDFVAKPLVKGARVLGGTTLGRIGKTPRRRPRTCCSRSARPAAAPRASTRSRSSTAGSCSSRPRSTAPRARTRCSAPTPRSPRSARSC